VDHAALANPAAIPANSAAPAPTPNPASVPAPPPIVKRAPDSDQQLSVACGLQSYYMFGQSRGGPTLDLEIGSGTRDSHGALLFRVYPGDTTGYLLGLRFEGWLGRGRYRLAFGAEVGGIMIPGNKETVDLALFGVQPLGVALEWQHVRVTAKLLGADLYLVPADQSLDRKIEAIYGLSSGLSLAVFQ
jgi:hypothetical protein